MDILTLKQLFLDFQIKNADLIARLSAEEKDSRIFLAKILFVLFLCFASALIYFLHKNHKCEIKEDWVFPATLFPSLLFLILSAGFYFSPVSVIELIK